MKYKISRSDTRKIILFLESLLPLIISRTKSLNIINKADSSPVTNLDIDLNNLILEFFKKNYPNDSLISEEHDSTISGQRSWIIDPVDGTKDLINKTGQWSVMIGCVLDKSPIFGFVYQPELNKLYFGSPNSGSYIKFGHKIQRIYSSRKYKPYNVRIVDSHNHPELLRDKLMTTFKNSEIYEYGSLGLKICHISEGSANFYLNTSGKCKIWDLCAGDAILRGAGGGIFNKNGLVEYDVLQPKVEMPFAGCSLRFAKHNGHQLSDLLF